MSRLIPFLALLVVACEPEIIPPWQQAVEPDPPRPAAVLVTPATADLTALGATVSLTAAVRDQHGQPMPSAAVSWSSGVPAVAAVDGTGVVTALANGTAAVTATAGTVSATATVTVAQVVAAVKVTPAADTVVEADTLRLAAMAADANGHPLKDAVFAWASNDNTVAVVDDSGLVTGVAPGHAVATATAAGVSGGADLVVAAAVPTAITVTPETVVLAALGQTVQLSAEVLDQIGRAMVGVSVSWSSSDPRVVAVDGAGLATAMGHGVATITAATGDVRATAEITVDLTVPGAPTGLRATPDGLKGSTQIRLNWSAPSNDGGSPITGYRIERAATRGGVWIIHVASTGSATTTYLDIGLTPNTTRYYRVRALNAQGHGDPSNVAEGTTNAARPGQPRNLRARATGPTSITLAWETPSSDGGERITGYTIQARGPSDGTWITIVRNTGSTATTFEHTGLRPASAYRYQVAAINRVGAGQWSFEASTSTYAQAPGAPVGLTAREVGTARIDLSWSAPRNTGGAPILGYRIEASDDGGSTWRIIRRNTNSKGTTFSDVNLQPATTRHYRVAAINTAGTGPFSNTARATTEATVPGTPRSLDAEADGTSRIELSWRAPTSDGGSRITGYRIEVSEDGGARWDDLVANSHNTRTTHVHTGLEPATTRHYRVSAINRIGVGRVSRVASAITDATVPDAPTGLVATAVLPTQIDLFWAAPTYDGGAPVTGYRIEVSENATAWTDLVVNTGSRATAFSHIGLLPGSTRHYRVSAINRVGASAPSASASAATRASWISPVRRSVTSTIGPA